ncbi:unnamed protein product [Owenia fusiformis]|uniref:Carboxylic ester hydrolase n=1 Tax=Owenia fusiformis TaxID=6347 RepID=A0A8S4Q9Q8_OWEFU|nr:unnamed protein product [Owenia fusiformis]
MYPTEYTNVNNIHIVSPGTFGQDGPIVEVEVGSTVRGVEEYMPNSIKPIYNFMGIPFAAPPVDDLRFQTPQEIPLWTGELDGTNYGDICPNSLPVPDPDMSEDCLFLNVWTPSTSQNANMAVMVWMYGGAFQLGDGDSYEGTELATLEDVVVVRFNYRVGVLGFLTMGDSNAPGNAGLLDQRMALQWVQRHIRSFGGNPRAVTIFGESAGCTQGDSARITTCLRNLHWEDIEDHSFEYLPGPHLDGIFLTDWPLSTYNMGEFNRVDYLLGFNQDEGYIFMEDADPTRENIATLIRDYLAVIYPENLEAIHQACMDVYVDYDSMVTDEDYERAYSYFIGDKLFLGQIHDIARKHSGKKSKFNGPSKKTFDELLAEKLQPYYDEFEEFMVEQAERISREIKMDFIQEGDDGVVIGEPSRAPKNRKYYGDNFSGTKQDYGQFASRIPMPAIGNQRRQPSICPISSNPPLISPSSETRLPPIAENQYTAPVPPRGQRPITARPTQRQTARPRPFQAPRSSDHLAPTPPENSAPTRASIQARRFKHQQDQQRTKAQKLEDRMRRAEANHKRAIAEKRGRAQHSLDYWEAGQVRNLEIHKNDNDASYERARARLSAAAKRVR